MIIKINDFEWILASNWLVLNMISFGYLACTEDAKSRLLDN